MPSQVWQNSILGQRYERPNTSCDENGFFFRVVSFNWPSRPKILKKSKNFKTQKIAKGLRLMLSFEILQKYHCKPELWPIPFSDKSWHFLTDFSALCHFLWFSLFSLPYVTFFGHFLSNPPQKSDPKGRRH